MEKYKIGLDQIKGALTRAEMGKIMAGSGGGSNDCPKNCSGNCTLHWPDGSTSTGTCGWTHGTTCTCGGGE